MNFIKKSIKRKLAVFIIILIFFTVLITSIVVIINYYNSLYSDFFKKNTIYAKTNAEIISNRYGSFYPLGYVEEFKTAIKEILNQNKDVKWFIMAKIDGELVYDSLHPDKKGFLVQEELLKQIEKNEFGIRKVKFNKLSLYEFTSPVIDIGNNTHLYTVIFYISDSLVTHSIVNMLFWVIIIAIVFIVIASLITTKIESIIIKPLNQLVLATKKVMKGDYNTRVDIKNIDEIGELAQTFNTMTTKILESFEKIEQQNIAIKKYNENLTEMVEKRTEELKKANIELNHKNNQIMQELEMAERVQQNIIPTDNDFPKVNQLAFGCNYSSMSSIGGDLYDVFRLSDNVYGFLMADVSGHGVPAALITSMAKVSFTSNSKNGEKPNIVCNEVNKEMFKLIGDLEYYLTAYYCVLNLETGLFEFCNAGHHPAILIHSDNGKIQKLENKKSFLIGSIEDYNYSLGSVNLNKGDKILLFTDGVIDARNSDGEFYDYKNLLNYISYNYHKHPKAFVDDLVKDINNFCRSRPQDDDRAILLVEALSIQDSNKDLVESIIVEARTIDESGTTTGQWDYSMNYKKAVDKIRSGEYNDALNILLDIMEKSPNHSKVLNSLGIVYYKLNRLKEAREVLQDAIKKDKENKIIRKNLNKVLKKMQYNLNSD